jgi:hypothetical protein
MPSENVRGRVYGASRGQTPVPQPVLNAVVVSPPPGAVVLARRLGRRERRGRG